MDLALNNLKGWYAINPNQPTKQNWFSRFCSNNTSLRDKLRPGYLSKFNQDALRELVRCNPCKSTRELALNLSTSTLFCLLEKIGKMSKLSIWLPVKYTFAGQYKTQTILCCSGTKRLLTSWLSFFDTRRERHNFYYADCTIWPNKRTVHPIAPKISVGRDLQNSMVSTPSWTDLAQGQISTYLFFQNHQTLSPSLPGMT